jgi:APA family basic amino acid/polyamine antiporter
MESATLGPARRPGPRSLGLFDVTLLVMGCVIGTSIFITPQVIAQEVKSQTLLLAAWALGGVFALCGSFAYAELAWRRPQVGGQYTYLRDAFHPGVAFLYGWCALLVTQTGSMASVALIFARYFKELTGSDADVRIITTVAITVLSLTNCLGIRTGSTVQNILMIGKIGAIGTLILCGFFFTPSRWWHSSAAATPAVTSGLVTDFGAAMVLIIFGYGGWQFATLVSGDVRDPRRNLPRGLIAGMIGVIVLYIGVNLVCARTLGADLAVTAHPASAVMRLGFGDRGATLIALGIAISAIGYLSQATMTTPRLYYAMAADGLFFKSVAWLHPRTQAPIVAILLQGVCAILISFSGAFEEILRYVMSVELIFGFLTVSGLFILRKHDAEAGIPEGFKAPGHPTTTIFFLVVSAAVVLNSYYKHPASSAFAVAIALSGIPVYLYWRNRNQRIAAPEPSIGATIP